jgi:hypothetical protein
MPAPAAGIARGACMMNFCGAPSSIGAFLAGALLRWCLPALAHSRIDAVER